MECATLLRVRMSTYQARQTGRPPVVDLTDLDVLGVSVAPDFRLQYRVAECKSGRVGSVELFWLRGVVEFFGADDAYLVVGAEATRTSSMRELASRLGVGILTADDFVELVPAYQKGGAELIVDALGSDRAQSQVASLSKELEGLHDYHVRLAWQFPQYRNLQLGVGYLERSRERLDAKNPAHVRLVSQHAFVYSLALFACCQSVLRRGIAQVSEQLPAYLYGGELGLREAQRRMAAVEEFQRKLEGERVDLAGMFGALPPYYTELLELITRLLRRPEHATAVLRHLQAVSARAVDPTISVARTLPDYDPLTVKLVNDIVAFLVKAAQLPTEFRVQIAAHLDGDQLDAADEGATKLAPGDAESKPDDGVQQELRIE